MDNQISPVTVDGEPVDYSLLPEQSQQPMRRYIEHRIRPGDFLYAVLSNDLVGAVLYADANNLDSLRAHLLWLHGHAPPQAFGNAERVKEWIA